MVKIPEMPIRQEKTLSSEFHMAMLRELEIHHDEKSLDWSTIPINVMMNEAERRLFRARTAYRAGRNEESAKQLVHAANYLTIAWARILSKQ